MNNSDLPRSRVLALLFGSEEALIEAARQEPWAALEYAADKLTDVINRGGQ